MIDWERQRLGLFVAYLINWVATHIWSDLLRLIANKITALMLTITVNEPVII